MKTIRETVLLAAAIAVLALTAAPVRAAEKAPPAGGPAAPMAEGMQKHLAEMKAALAALRQSEKAVAAAKDDKAFRAAVLDHLRRLDDLQASHLAHMEGMMGRMAHGKGEGVHGGAGCPCGSDCPCGPGCACGKEGPRGKGIAGCRCGHDGGCGKGHGDCCGHGGCGCDHGCRCGHDGGCGKGHGGCCGGCGCGHHGVRESGGRSAADAPPPYKCADCPMGAAPEKKEKAGGGEPGHAPGTAH